MAAEQEVDVLDLPIGYFPEKFLIEEVALQVAPEHLLRFATQLDYSLKDISRIKNDFPSGVSGNSEAQMIYFIKLVKERGHGTLRHIYNALNTIDNSLAAEELKAAAEDYVTERKSVEDSHQSQLTNVDLESNAGTTYKGIQKEAPPLPPAHVRITEKALAQLAYKYINTRERLDFVGHQLGLSHNEIIGIIDDHPNNIKSAALHMLCTFNNRDPNYKNKWKMLRSALLDVELPMAFSDLVKWSTQT